MNLHEWAARWGLPEQALTELAMLTVHQSDPEGYEQKTEAFSQSQVRLEAPHFGAYLWRNNVGAGKIETGGFMRWGLANDSKQLNEKLKSGDLIGGRRRLITNAMVGQTILQFTSRECKRPSWKYTGTPEEIAQVAWATLINAQGGDAKIVTGPGSFA